MSLSYRNMRLLLAPSRPPFEQCTPFPRDILYPMGVLPRGKTRLEQGGDLIPVDSLHFAPDADPTGPARLLTFVMMALHRRGRLRLRQVLAEQRSRQRTKVRRRERRHGPSSKRSASSKSSKCVTNEGFPQTSTCPSASPHLHALGRRIDDVGFLLIRESEGASAAAKHEAAQVKRPKLRYGLGAMH